MSARIAPLRSLLVHLWLHPTAGGWVAASGKAIDPDWPTLDAEWLPVTSAARTYARRIADRHSVPLLVHGRDF